jgi:glycosyltransferase involved in cell wall biosynthesis
MNQPLRILYSAGPGDVINTYRHWLKGEDDPTQLSMTYSGMFYQACRDGDDRAYVIASCVRKDALDDGRFRIVHRPSLFLNGPGPLFYVGQVWTELRLIASAIRYRADVALIACGNTSWIVLRLMPLFGITVIPSLHCVLWSKYRKLTTLQRVLRRMRVPFFTKTAFRILSASDDITQQLVEMTGNRQRPVVPFLPSYRRKQFESGVSAATERQSFRILFAGRIERNKGVFDLLAIAKRFEAEGRKDIAFDVCGTGSSIDELRRQAAAASLSDRFVCHGHCNRETMQSMYARCHAVIVPTTGDFVEGFNQVVAEAVLAGRPVITSEVCPALGYVRDAVVEVPVDDVKAYGDSILKLCDDAEFYDAKQKGCLAAQEQFYNLDNSWMHAVRHVLDEFRKANSGADVAELTAISNPR